MFTYLFVICVDVLMFSIDHFHEVLLQYKYACFFRERLDGSLRGMVLIDPQMGLVKEGRRYNCIKVRHARAHTHTHKPKHKFMFTDGFSPV